MNGGWFWGLGAMIEETMMKFSGSRTMRVSTLGIFLRNLPKSKNNENDKKEHKNYICINIAIDKTEKVDPLWCGPVGGSLCLNLALFIYSLKITVP